MNTQLNIFPAIKCDMCGERIESDGHLFDGFMDADNKMMVHTNCKQKYYVMKQGDAESTTYSEMPITLNFLEWRFKERII
ncbi:MAG: hypothetical protein KA954_12890 [Chitinophagales bacterium]|nr:hypothetical protein [Chitinophagales bacterium]MBP8754193.1 hypothetical protein [Chitinophagales bacterium]